MQNDKFMLQNGGTMKGVLQTLSTTLTEIFGKDDITKLTFMIGFIQNHREWVSSLPDDWAPAMAQEEIDAAKDVATTFDAKLRAVGEQLTPGDHPVILGDQIFPVRQTGADAAEVFGATQTSEVDPEVLRMGDEGPVREASFESRERFGRFQ